MQSPLRAEKAWLLDLFLKAAQSLGGSGRLNSLLSECTDCVSGAFETKFKGRASKGAKTVEEEPFLGYLFVRPIGHLG